MQVEEAWRLSRVNTAYCVNRNGSAISGFWYWQRDRHPTDGNNLINLEDAKLRSDWRPCGKMER